MAPRITDAQRKQTRRLILFILSWWQAQSRMWLTEKMTSENTLFMYLTTFWQWALLRRAVQLLFGQWSATCAECYACTAVISAKLCTNAEAMQRPFNRRRSALFTRQVSLA
jgi:hypothetical protein